VATNRSRRPLARVEVDGSVFFTRVTVEGVQAPRAVATPRRTLQPSGGIPPPRSCLPPRLLPVMLEGSLLVFFSLHILFPYILQNVDWRYSAAALVLAASSAGGVEEAAEDEGAGSREQGAGCRFSASSCASTCTLFSGAGGLGLRAQGSSRRGTLERTHTCATQTLPVVASTKC